MSTAAGTQQETGAAPRRGGALRGALWLVVGLVLVTIGALVVAGLAATGWLFGGERDIDRSGPAVLQAVEDLSEYRAATGHFQVVVDVEQDDPILPSFLRGERTLFVANGTVDATVDFGGLGEDAIEVTPDRTGVRVRLPRPTLSQAVVDPEGSYVYDRQRGLLDRIGGVFQDEPTGERELYLRAEQRMEDAAAQSELLQTAETNTRDMLERLLRALGFAEVSVEYETAP
jgi:hypothetical protein